MDAIVCPSRSAVLTSPVPSLFPCPQIVPNSPPATKAQSKRKPNTTAGIAKAKLSKSRNGCNTCKAKRLKCDEIKPICQQCHKRNVECGGYKKDFKWRSFVEATFTSKPAPQRPRKPSPSIKAECLAHDSPCFSDDSESTVGPAFSQTSLSLPYAQSSPIPKRVFPQVSTLDPADRFCPNASSYTIEKNSYPVSTASFSDPAIVVVAQGITNTRYSENTSRLNHTRHGLSSRTLGQSSRLINPLLPGPGLNTPPNYTDYQLRISGVAYQLGDVMAKHADMDLNGAVEARPRGSDPAIERWIAPPHSRSPSSSSSSPGLDSPRFDPLNYVYSQPKLHASSPEMLMLGFDKQTCGILSVKDGPTENPWRTLIWPLARESPALYHAISSLTAFHSSKMKPEMKMAGMDHMRRSVRHLAHGIGNMRLDAALATTLVLAFSESWDVHVSTGIEHLRGAKILMDQALARQSQGVIRGEDQTRLRFLCNTWVYMDVISRLTNVDDDAPIDLGSFLWASLGPQRAMAEIDPLMGCASTLFPLIGRVANLVRKVRKSACNSIDIISQANDLKILVEAWKPPESIETPEDPTSEARHSLQTAESYRWATLLYLHQAVPDIPSGTAAQLAKRALVYLAMVPLSSRLIIVHIYPLLAASCEATSYEDRMWVEGRWTAMSQRMHIGNIDRCVEVVKEVWQRRDIHDAEMTHRRLRRGNSKTGPDFPSPMLSIKKTFSSGSSREIGHRNWPKSTMVVKHRATRDEAGILTPIKINQSEVGSQNIVEDVEYEKTVRGRLHWVGVMKDWKWEILLG